MNTINGIESFKKTQDVVIYLRQLKKDMIFNQAGIVKEVADLIIHAASVGSAEDDYINVVEIVAANGALWKMTIDQRNDLIAEIKIRFNRDRRTFTGAVNEKQKELQAAMPDNEKTRMMVDEMNKTHANTIMGGKNVIMRKIQNPSDAEGATIIEFIRPYELAGVYANDLYVVGYNKKTTEAIKKDRITAWTQHENCITYSNGVYMEPIRPQIDGQQDDFQIRDGALNLWNGFSVQPKHGGSWEKIDWHIRHILAGGRDDVYKYLLDWCAHAIQYPERRAGSAIVFRGTNGIGKGIFSTFFKNLWGEHGFATSNPKHIVGNFNRHLINTCLLFADEALLAGNKLHENTMKSLVTEEWIALEGKGLDVINVKNRLKIMMATNSDWAVATNRNDRRFCICDVSPEKHKNYAYFSALAEEMENKATKQAFIYDMLQRDISNYVSGEIPVTEGLKEQRADSLPTVWQWWRDCLAREYVKDQSSNGILWLDIDSSENLYKSYMLWCNETKQSTYNILSRTKFGKEFTSVYEKIRENGYIHYKIGFIDDAEKTFKEYFGI